MNTKLLFVIIAAVAVIGGFMAVKNLKNSTAVDDAAITSSARDEKDADNSADDDDDSARIGSISTNSKGSQNRRSLANRPIKRGPSAAALDVTPATTSSAHTPVAAGQNRPLTDDEREENRSIADLTNMFKNEKDPDERIAIAEKMGLIDSAESIRNSLELLRSENDPEVQEALIEAMQGLEAQDEMADEIFRVVTDIYTKTDNADVKIAAQDLMGDLSTADAAAGLRTVLQSGGDIDDVKINAAENILRIGYGGSDIVKPEEAAGISNVLKTQYSSADNAGTRQQIIMALATEGKKNAEFFQQALNSEQDPQNREMLQRLVRMFNAPPPATPPPGTVITPVPTLIPTPA